MKSWMMKMKKSKKTKRQKRHKSRKIRGCKSKKTFYKFEQAKQLTIKIKRRTGKVLLVYECLYCNNYHLYSEQRTDRTKKRRGK